MNLLMHALLAMGLSAPAWAADGPSNATTTTQWEIYGFCVAAFVVGFAWLLWYKKREEKRDKSRQSRSADPA